MNEGSPVRLPITTALLVVGLTVIGATLAAALDIPSAFVIGEAQRGDLGIEVIWEGSAISAPLAPILGLAIGIVLARRVGATRTAGLGLLTLAGLVMVIGVVGEFTGDTSFDGVRRVLFLLVNVAYGILAMILVASSLVAIVKREVAQSA